MKVTEPAFSKVSVSSVSSPAASGRTSPIIITCSPLGASVAGASAETSIAATGRIRATPAASSVWACSPTLRAAGLAAAIRRSAPPVVAVVMNAAEAPPSEAAARTKPPCTVIGPSVAVPLAPCIAAICAA